MQEENDSTSFGLFFPRSLKYIEEIAYHCTWILSSLGKRSREDGFDLL